MTLTVDRLLLTSTDRLSIEDEIERLIAILDQLDGDADVEWNGVEYDCNLAGASTERETDPAYFDCQGLI